MVHVTHSAFVSTQVVANLPLKIESVEPYGTNKLLVGTSDGVLFVYEYKPTQSAMDYSIVHKTFAKKPIVQLSAVDDPRYNILISLSDSTISVHDLITFDLRFQVVKGCNLYTVEKTERGLYICASVKKRLLVYGWEGKQFVETKELPIPEPARCIIWCKDRLCVGYKKEYHLINLQTRATSELFPTGKSLMATGICLPDEQILVGRDDLSIFLKYTGEPARQQGLIWSENPQSVGFSSPCILAVLSKSVEVNLVTGSRNSALQSITLRNPKVMGIKGDSIYVASSTCIWKLTPVPIPNQVDQLVASKNYETALEICNYVSGDDQLKGQMTNSVKKSYAIHHFTEGRFEDSMALFQELKTDPLSILAFFPGLLPRKIQPKMSSISGMLNEESASLNRAMLALVKYIQKIRPLYVGEKSGVKKSEDKEWDDCEDFVTILDTCDLKARIKVDPKGLVELVTNKDNYCHLQESRRCLLIANKETELVSLYRSKGLHRDALELLSKLKWSVPLIVYLKQLGKQELDLILEFSAHPLKTQPEESLTIFTVTRTAENHLPSGLCLTHIKNCAPQLVALFLEYLIHQQGETSAEFHNELVLNYLERIKALKASIEPNASKRGVSLRNDTGMAVTIRKRLVSLLEESKYYNPEKMLVRFREDLYEERAILLKRLGLHERAISIYVHDLGDLKLAEEYCVQNYNPAKEEGREIFLSLIRVLLRDTEKQGYLVRPAIEVLTRHHKFINVSKVLDLLPPSTSLSDLFPALEATVRDRTTETRHDHIVKNLLKSENLEMRENWMRGRSRYFKVDEGTYCGVCAKRIGPNAFAGCPNGVIVHYACLKDRNTCPVTNTSFKNRESQLTYS